MKITEAQNTVVTHAVTATTDNDSTSAEVAQPTVIVDRVSTDEAVEFRASVANGIQMATTERAMRLQSLTLAVRAGAYRPSVSRLADQILAQAEMEARLAAAFN